ncbi:MAG TPA: type II secretion system protein N [Gammaproteobacteria bacterium]|jgi:hypothetical protein
MVSGALVIVATGIIWSMLPQKSVVPVAVPPATPALQTDSTVIAQQVASAHLFGTGTVAASASPTIADITVEGIIYSDEKDSALVVLKIDGNSNIFRVGDTLPDGEKVLALAPTAVQLGSPGSPRVIALQQYAGGDGSAPRFTGGAFGQGSAFTGMQIAGTPAGYLKPVDIPLDADPMSQLRALRQQLIRQQPAVPPVQPAKKHPSP